MMAQVSGNSSLAFMTEADNDVTEKNWDIPLWVTAIGGVGMIVLILLAVVGNLLVIISYFRDKQLQTVHNMYILNLAVTDFFIGVVCMTFYADFTLRPWVWVFGKVFCKIWCVTDYVMCLNSVLLMLLLSLDRVILLRNGAGYMAKETKRVAMVKLTVSWTISFVVYGPCVVFWDIARGYSVVEVDNCNAEFFTDAGFSTVSAVCEMTIPCIALSVLNTMVFLKIRKRLHFFNKNKRKVTPSDETKVVIPTVFSETKVNSVDETEVGVRKVAMINNEEKSFVGPVKMDSLSQKANERKESSHNRNLKAAKFLAVLVVAFLTTWAPYTFANLIMTQCEDCVNHHLFEFFTWLLWAKSSINPFLYASQSKQFKDNFVRLLPFLKFCTKYKKMC